MNKELQAVYTQGRRDERARCIRVGRKLATRRFLVADQFKTEFRQGQADGVQLAVDALARQEDIR